MGKPKEATGDAEPKKTEFELTTEKNEKLWDAAEAGDLELVKK